MDTNEMRAEFEAAFVAKYGFGRLTASANADAHAIYEAAKWAWQASREAVVVELPKFEDYPASMERDMQQALRIAIEAQGLKVTP
ncbi:hypothetical protein [Pseudomonas sp. S36]|uniref:hypothetical protein n=1 Tax=Pseudomonas sp. S36 TaxID=2767447 RepID=UPI0019125B77|nr:hypothetical protein [Pseudomonas sp. S36]MBK4989790.1 hypothetical protein [Pseudomonas sp. S36]